jgi:ABC-2 type transport system permease protein
LFASTALYPLWRLNDANPTLATAAWLNPFGHAVELSPTFSTGAVERTKIVWNQ